jgi:hypothetical protein
MSIETALKLKADLTDKYVVVKPGVPELMRFGSWTGVVKTVNMSGRALVEFDGPVDISWYDIDPEYLTIVDAPAKKIAEKHAAPAKANDDQKGIASESSKTPAAKPIGKSALDMARAQGTGTAAPATVAASAAAPAKKLSALEMARQQGATKAGTAAAPAGPASNKAEAAPAVQPAEKKLSPLEAARMQGAGKGPATSAPAAASVPPVAPATSSTSAAEPKPAVAAPTAPSGKKPSPLEMARQQGAFKGK